MSCLVPQRRQSAPGLLLAVGVLALAACTPLPQRASIPTLWNPSPNHDLRRPNYVVLHHTTNSSVEPALGTLTTAGSGVSAHYLIGRDGGIHQLVDERARLARRRVLVGRQYGSELRLDRHRAGQRR